MGIAALRDQRPPSMSGGEQQRVAISRVLAQRVRVLLADEPTCALDMAPGERALVELGQVAHNPGRCAVVVTHDPRVAAACDRVLFLLDGRLARELGSPDAEQVAATLAELTAEAESRREATAARDEGRQA